MNPRTSLLPLLVALASARSDEPDPPTATVPARGGTVTDEPAWCVAYGRDGRTLATGHTGGWIRLRDAATGELLGACAGHEKAVRSLALRPALPILASGGEDGTIRLWR